MCLPPGSLPRRARSPAHAHLDGQGQQRPLRAEPQQTERGRYVLLATV